MGGGGVECYAGVFIVEPWLLMAVNNSPLKGGALMNKNIPVHRDHVHLLRARASGFDDMTYVVLKAKC